MCDLALFLLVHSKGWIRTTTNNKSLLNYQLCAICAGSWCLIANLNSKTVQLLFYKLNSIRCFISSP